jgi:hypothetical protein
MRKKQDALERNPSTSSGRAQRELNAVFTTELVEVSGRAQRELNAVFTAKPVEVSGRAQRELNVVFTAKPVEVSGRAQRELNAVFTAAVCFRSLGEGASPTKSQSERIKEITLLQKTLFSKTQQPLMRYRYLIYHGTVRFMPNDRK